MKRILSLILATVMLISLLPAVSFATDTRETLVYSFLKADNNKISNAALITYEIGNKNLQYLSDDHGSSTSNDFSKWDGANSSARFSMASYWGSGNKFYQYAAYNIKGIEKGEYTVTLDYAVHSAGVQDVEMYLLDPETTAELTAGKTTVKDEIDDSANTAFFADVNMYSETAGSGSVSKRFNVETAGEHTIVFIRRSKNGSQCVTPKTLTFKPYVTPVFEEVEHSLGDTGFVGKEIKFTAQINTPREIFIPEKDGDGLEVSLSNTDVAELVDASYADGVYTATLKTKTTGDVDILFTVTVEGVTEEVITHPFSVIEMPDPYEFEISFAKPSWTGISTPADFTYENTGGLLEWLGTTSTNGTKYAFEGSAAYYNLAKGKYAAYKMYFPAEGKYTVGFDYNTNATAGCKAADVYLIPGVPEDISAAVKSATPLFDDVCFYSADDPRSKQITTVLENTNGGDYTLVFIARDEGYTVRPVKLTFKPYITPECVDVVHTISDSEVAENTISFEAYALRNDGFMFVPTAEGDEIIVTSETPDIAEITDISVTDGIVKANLVTKTAGTASFLFTAVLGESKYSESYTMEITEAMDPYPIRIEMTQDTMVFEDQTKPSEAWQTDGFELVFGNNKMTSSKNQRYTPRFIGSKYFVEISTGSGVWPDTKNRQFTIKKKILAAGWYKVDFTGVRVATSADYSIYVNGEYAGDFIFHDAAATDSARTLYTVTKSLNTIYLPYGYVEISFRARRINTDNDASFVPYYIDFTPAEGNEAPVFDHAEADLSAMVPVDEVGERASLSLVMSDGTNRHFGLLNSGKKDGNNTIVSIEATDSSIAGVTDVEIPTAGDTDKVYFTVIGKKPGTTGIKVVALIDGEDVIGTVPVEIIATPTLDQVDVSFGDNTLPVSRTTDTKLYLTRSTDFKEYTYKIESIKYRTSDETVAVVDEETGEVTGIKEGSATIYADVTDWAGNEVTGEAEIQILPKPVLASIEVDVATVLVTGKTSQLSVSAVMNDGLGGDISNYEVSYSSTDENVVKIDENGLVTAVSEGEASITVVAIKEDGTRCMQTVKISVYDAVTPITIPFGETVVSLDSAFVLTSTPGYTVDKSITKKGSYKIYNVTGKDMLNVYTGSQVWPVTSKKFTNGAFAVDFNARVEGDYAITLEGAIHYYNSNCSVFVNGKYAGDYKFNDPKPVTYRDIGDAKELNSIHLNEGTNKVVIAVREKIEDNDPRITVREMIFTPLEKPLAYERIEVDVPSEISVGETIDLSAYVYMNDGSVRHFGPSYAGELSDKDNRVTLSDENNLIGITVHTPGILADGKNDFTVTGITPGETKLAFTVYIDGEPITETFDIEVVSSPLDSTGARVEAETLYAGDASRLIATPTLENNHVVSHTSSQNSFESLTPDIAEITGEDGNILQTYKAGTAIIKVTSTFNNVTVKDNVEIKIEEAGFTEFIVTAGGSERIRLTDKGSEDTVPIYITAYDNLGNELDTTDIIITAVAKNPEYATVNSASGSFVPVAEGDAYFDVTVELDGRIRNLTDVLIPVVYGKSRATYYTAEKAENARENAARLDTSKVKSYVNAAEKYLPHLDTIYSLITSQGVPRAHAAGMYNDRNTWYCRFCGTNLMTEYGQFPWQQDPISRPWKTQCPECKRLFPSNDFESFYELGLNDYGEFDRLRALETHREMLLKKGVIDTSVTDPGKEHSKSWKAYYGYGNPEGFLYNELYKNTDLSKVETLNCGMGLRPGETQETWGVDDSWGYVPATDDGEFYYAANGELETHTYVAVYNHFGLFRQQEHTTGAVLQKAINQCANAYFYTGELKYGRVAAILLDRLADFYKDYDILPYQYRFANTDGGAETGKSIGCIWECEEVTKIAAAYDMVFDVYEKDPYVVEYLRNKSKTIKMRHSKDTAAQIRTNFEDGYLRAALEALRTKGVSGNFGMPQKANALCAVVLDSKEDTEYWLDYLFAPGWTRAADQDCRGGGILEVLMNTIDSDGQGDEASFYNLNWSTGLISVQEYLEGYDGYTNVNLLENPKFVQLFYSCIPMMSTYYTPQIGDTNATCGTSHWISAGTAVDGWRLFKDPIFAQVAYKLNGNTVKGLYYDLTEENPERLQDEIQEVIDTYGPLNQGSGAMTSFGFGMLRDHGEYTESTQATAKDVSRDVWMYFGANAGHGHRDTLNIGLTAFGLNMLPEHGYPAKTGSDPERMQWTDTTVSHNTVVVNKTQQGEYTEPRGKMKHFDDDGQVKLMDVAANYVYKTAEQYRRSVVMVRVDDDVSYVVDFFRVLGGDTHTYSFHASSNTIAETPGLSLVPQADEKGNYVGTYAGKDVPFGNDTSKPAYPTGYTWLKNVDRDESPENTFEVDFEIRDFRKVLRDSKGLHLRMTVLNDSNIAAGASANVAIADGLPPQVGKNKAVDKLKYVLIENSGENLDTVFTTVIEPYKTDRYLESSSELKLEVADGEENDGDARRAVMVIHKDGRVDYIFFATNNSVTYKVTDKIAGENRDILFRGFVGVYTVNADGDNIYKYVHDGDIIGEDKTVSTATVEGVIKDFTKELTTDNKIVFVPERDLTDEELEDISDRYIFIDNGEETRSGTFRIYDAERSGDDIVLSVGNITPIRKYKDLYDTELGYIYMIAEGQSARIPATYSEDFAPEFEPISSSLSVSAGSSISVPLTATSKLGENVTYSGNTLPRGASLNAETGVVTWKPTGSQVGKNHFAVTATDESGRQTTVHFYIEVYGATTGSSSSDGEDNAVTETPSAGGGGGGGGTPDTGNNSENTDVSNDEDTTPSDENTGTAPDASGETEKLRFTDLGNHAWAEDSINTLADDGIIRGTTATTYSPANNITRADFASLLVRAFNLSSENTENFADVTAADYFATELAVARNTGIVNGIGDNKYAPRNTITRQDMMVITYRAMQNLGNEPSQSLTATALPEGELSGAEGYADFTSVASYAREAVTTLIGAGIVNGKNNLIAPTDYTTRAEVAVLIKRIMDYTKK